MSPISGLQWKVIVPVAVLVTAGVLVWQVLIGFPGQLSADIRQPEPTEIAELTETPSPNEWSSLVSRAVPSSVALQTFSAGQVVRFGTGTVVSSDGLVVTVTDVVPFASPSAVYQVTTSGKVLRASVVARDYSKNLALLKTDVADLTIAQVTQTRPLVGTPLALIGGLVEVSAYTPYFVHAWLSYDSGRFGVLDADFQPILAGGRVLATDGRQVGIVFLRAGQVRIVWMDDVDAFVQEYLEAVSVQ